MSKCNWDPAKHGGRECPIHGAGGSMWDENILTKQDKINKLKEKGYTEDEIEEELKGVGFDDDFEFDDEKLSFVDPAEGDEIDDMKGYAYEEFVKSDEDKKVWDSLSEDDKLLLGKSLDIGFENDLEDDEKEEILGKLNELRNKFGNNNEEFNEEDFVNHLDETDFDKAEKNERKNKGKHKHTERKDKYGNALVSDEAFKAGQKGARAYLNDALKYDDLDTLKKSNIFLGGLRQAASKAIIEEGYDPDLDITYQDLNEIIGSVLDEDVDLEEYERNATKGFTGKKYSGYQPNSNNETKSNTYNGKETKLPKTITDWFERNKDTMDVEIEEPSGDDTVYFKITDKNTGEENYLTWNPRTKITNKSTDDKYGELPF